MPQNLFARPRSQQGVFKDERYLYPEFIPERLPHRDEQIDTLVYAFNPLLGGRKPHNVFLSGSTGTGKTACARFVLRQLEEHSDRAKFLYINCFEYTSRRAVLFEIATFLGAAVPRRGVASDEVYSRILEAMEKIRFTPIIVLDEIDQLMHAAESSRLLYDLLRVVEHKTMRFGIVLISNDTTLTARLDERVRSSLAEERIEFAPYTPMQLKEILRERAEQAFNPGVLGADVIPVAAAHAAKLGGDARIAIEALWKAGREAERSSSKSVNLEHLQKAFKIVDASSLLKGLRNLTADEKTLLKILAQDSPGTMRSSSLYERFAAHSKQQLTDRRVRSLIYSLERRRLISTRMVDLGNKGKAKEITLSVPNEMLLNSLEGESGKLQNA